MRELREVRLDGAVTPPPGAIARARPVPPASHAVAADETLHP